MKKFVFIVICFSNLPAFGQQRDTLRMEGHFYYLADIDSRTIAERIMNGQLRPSDNWVTFRILDSLTSPYQRTRQYFLPVFNKILELSDGALAEVMGTPVIKYLRDYPSEFIKTVGDSKSPELFELYSNAAAYELYFSTDYKAEIAKLRRDVSDKCPACVGSNTIAEFLDVTAQKTADI